MTPLVLNDASPSKQHDLHQNRVNMSQLPIVMCCRVLYAVYCCPRDDAAVCLPRDLACLPACLCSPACAADYPPRRCVLLCSHAGRGTHARDHEGHSAPHIQDPQGRFLRKHPESCTVEVVAVIVSRPNRIDHCCRRRQAARVGWIII